MIDLGPSAVVIIFVVGILVCIMSGMYVGAAVAGVAFVLGFLALGPAVTAEILYTRVYNFLLHYTMIAVVGFVFMGSILERSGISDKLYEALQASLGGIRGGLAIATVLAGTILATCMGIIAASVTILTLLGFTAMVRRGYDRSLAAGSVCAAGTLGILIPPSVMLVFYGPMADISVGKLFMGAFGPGFLLAVLYCAYIVIRSIIQPKVAPRPSVEGVRIPLAKRVTMLITALLPPGLLVLAVLGSIFLGIAAPTEAAALGAVMVVLLSVAYRKFSWKMLKSSAMETIKVAGFIMLIAPPAVAAVGIFMACGGEGVIRNFLLIVPGGSWGAFAAVMVIIIILGTFLEWMGIIFILVPILSPIIPELGFNPLWFAIMVCVNLQIAFLSPPFASAIFICKGAAPPEYGLTMGEIIRGVIPFAILVMIGLGICVAFPQIILWLPSQMRTGW